MRAYCDGTVSSMEALDRKIRNRLCSSISRPVAHWQPSCDARRMAESTALLVSDVFPAQPVRQCVLSYPYPLRFLFASRPAIMSHVLVIVYRGDWGRTTLTC